MVSRFQLSQYPGQDPVSLFVKPEISSTARGMIMLTNITNRPSHLNSEEDGSSNHEREAKPLYPTFKVG